MSLSLSSKRLTHLAQSAQTSTEFARIERTDGQVFGLSNHVADLVMGGVTYASGSGYTPTAISSTAEYRPSSVDVEGILAAAGVPRSDIELGLFDHATIYIFRTDYTDPVVDEHPLFAGAWGTVRLMEGRYVTEFQSLKDYLGQNIGRTHKASCDAVLGDSACGVQLQPDVWQATTAYTVRQDGDALVGDVVRPTTENGAFFKCTTAGTSDASEPTWDTTIGNTTNDGTVVWEAIQGLTLTGIVTSVTDNRVFGDSSRVEADGWWDYGSITWTTGNNAGASQEVKTYADSGGTPTFTLFLPMRYTVQVGDQYTVRTGCRKRFSEDCVTKFDNSDNFQGFPFIPTTDDVGRFGGQ